jgi:predicted NAD-dependent protein-ADP-ribosyltransferase YbiA (DUF1768 family)/SAM-dependent methyltransferase
MELYPAEIEGLRQLVQEWVTHPDYELESSFGAGGVVSSTTFLNVAQRLKAKGYVELPQEDYMNILTPDNVRFTIKSMRAIQSYCRDNILEGKPFEAMVKDRAVKMSNLDIPDYETRIKIRRENSLAQSTSIVQDQLRKWPSQKKAFRLIRRWTFMDEANGIRVDMSIVRSTPKFVKKNGSTGDYKWQRTFLERDITKEAPVYEIEVEKLRTDLPEGAEAAAEQTEKQLIRGIGEILRGMNKHSLLIRKSVAEKVKAAYTKLVGTDQFRGVKPVAYLIQHHRAKPEKGFPNIRSGYNVTDKADGLRVHAFTSESGELYMIDMSMNVYRTGLRNAVAKNALMDGEWVTKDKEGRAIQMLLLFDAYVYKGVDVSKLPFAGKDVEKKEDSRYGAMMEWVDMWMSGDGPRITAPGVTEINKLLVSAKQYEFGIAGDLSIFAKAAQVLDTLRVYYTDGLIFTPNDVPIPGKPGVGWPAQLKWKPSHDNTVDFLVEFVKDPSTGEDLKNWAIHEDGKDRIQYKTLRLYVGSTKDYSSQDPRGVILFEQPWAEEVTSRGRGGRIEYRPVLFSPMEFPDTMANRCYSELHMDPMTGEEYISCEQSGDPIQDHTIVEMMYDPSKEPGWRWKPLRIRYDKTERLQQTRKYGATLNKDDSAEGVWNSIHDPVTEGMIRRGVEQPLPSETGAAGTVGTSEGDGLKEDGIKRVYYKREAPANDLKLLDGLRKFHNEWVKEKILLGSGLRGGGKTLIDFACGQGGDIFKWVRMEPRFCFGIDIAGEGIRDPQQGAYARYLKGWKRNGQDNMPRIVFAIGNSAHAVVSGEAGATPEEQDIMRAVLGRQAPTSTVPPYVEKYCAGALATGADCAAIMFAFHYFFESEESLNGILGNIRDCLKPGGLFIGCCFDGKKVFDALRAVPKDGSLTGQERSKELWKITKRYSETEFVNGPESLGMAIDVEFISIGTEQREFLVNFKYVESKMKEYGLEYLTAEECKELGLPSSTALFEESYDQARVAKMNYPMLATIKQYSFFNRWFIFRRRRGEGDVAEEGVFVEAAAPALTGELGPGAGEAASNDAPTYGAVTPPEQQEKTFRERVAEIEAAGPKSAADRRALSDMKKWLAERESTLAAAAAAPPSVAAAPPAPPGKVAAAEGVMRTLPTEAPASEKRMYALNELYQFWHDAPLNDRLKLKDMSAARYLDPSAPFKITDPRTGKQYPSMEHYIAAMKYQLASNKPELGEALFSSEVGSVHRKFRDIRAAETGDYKRKLSESRDHDLLKQERLAVIEESRATAFKKYRTIFDESIWNGVKDGVLEEALKQRWENDARFRTIVQKAREMNLVLLYYTGNVSGSDMGGMRAAGGVIDGENKVGRIIMRLAGFSGF